MPCTTLLVGKNATYDGSTMIARNEDSGSGHYSPKKLMVVKPEDQPKTYHSVISHVTIELPDHPLRYTCMPNAGKEEGIWGAAGVNSANVAMTATETITSNERVLCADPPVRYQPAKDGQPEKAGGIGEEDIVSITLPYIHSAREGVRRLGSLLEQYGTYELNGIAFQDVDEVWYLETIGGHHWLARRVPDDAYVAAPNMFFTDAFDFDDAYGAQKDYMCSSDLKKFTEENHLDLSQDGVLNPREAYGSHSDEDHVYNTPRTWAMERFFNPGTYNWDGPDADYSPVSDDLPWCLVPERKITVEDAKYALSNHFQGTRFDPYGHYGDLSERGRFRPIGINRTNFLSLTQIRPYMPPSYRAVEWFCYASNVHNCFVPIYANVDKVPSYYQTPTAVTTDSLYWSSRIAAALADPYMSETASIIEGYQLEMQSLGHYYIRQRDQKGPQGSDSDPSADVALNEQTNEEIAGVLRQKTQKLLAMVLNESSNGMRNRFSRSDA